MTADTIRVLEGIGVVVLTFALIALAGWLASKCEWSKRIAP